MKRCGFLFFSLLLAWSVQAQQLTLEREAKLYERPNLSAPVKTTLPAGLILKQIATQGEWIAVTTDDGLTGWVPQDTFKAPAQKDDDLLGSIRDAAQNTSPQAAGDPTPASSPGTPTTASSTGPPPPPPAGTAARPDNRAAEDGEDSGLFSSRGVYNASQWIRAAFHMADELRGLRADWGRLLGQIAELNLWVDGAKSSPGGDTGGLGKQSSSCCGESYYSVEGGVGLNLYVLQPADGRPVGIYVGGQSSYGQVFVEHTEGTTTSLVKYGGGAGVYGHLPAGRGTVIPRAEVQLIRNRTTVSYDDFPEFDGTTNATGWRVNAGVEMSFGRFVPGVMVQSDRIGGTDDHESITQTTFRVSVTFTP